MMNNVTFSRIANSAADKLDEVVEKLGDESPEARVAAEVASSIASYLRDEAITFEPGWRDRYEKLLAFLTDRNWAP